jgi:hypothetical protein
MNEWNGLKEFCSEALLQSNISKLGVELSGRVCALHLEALGLTTNTTKPTQIQTHTHTHTHTLPYLWAQCLLDECFSTRATSPVPLILP